MCLINMDQLSPLIPRTEIATVGADFINLKRLESVSFYIGVKGTGLTFKSLAVPVRTYRCNIQKFYIALALF